MATPVIAPGVVGLAPMETEMRILLTLLATVPLFGCAGLPHPLDCALGITLYDGYCDLDPGTVGYYKQHPEKVAVAPVVKQ